MVKHVAQTMAVFMVILAGVIINGLVTPGGVSSAQNNARTMRELLQQLVDDHIRFLVWFVTPVSEDRPYWDVPGELEYEGNIMGRRLVREIGDDYLCVDEIGQGATFTICVPFTNIAYVDFLEYRPLNIPPD